MTRESLVPEDTDINLDVYERTAGETILVSVGPNGGNGPAQSLFGGVSKDNQHALVHTTEPLDAADTDFKYDIYDRFGSSTTFVTPGGSGGWHIEPVQKTSQCCLFIRHPMSPDGSVVLFHTYERMTPDDTDLALDVYASIEEPAPAAAQGPASAQEPPTQPPVTRPAAAPRPVTAPAKPKSSKKKKARCKRRTRGSKRKGSRARCKRSARKVRRVRR